MAQPKTNRIPRDMEDALSKFDKEATKIVKSFSALLQRCVAPPIIYHYTNEAGLRGILETRCFWLSDIFNLNDPSELRHGLSHAMKILKAKADSGPPESKLFARYWSSFIERGGTRKSAHYFMCSFSFSGDDLGQWRAYADNGRGYALGFDTAALETKFRREAAPIVRAFPITYENHGLVALHRQIVELMFDLISLPQGRQLAPAIIRAYWARLMTLLMVHALDAAVYFKHEAYSNEKEYRFLEAYPIDKPPSTKLRQRPYSLIRYREFSWASLAAAGVLKRIVVGPAADKEKAVQFAEDCMTVFSLKTVDIVKSEIPYRAA